MKASKILTDNRPIGHQSNIVEGSDGPVTDSRQSSPHQQLRGTLMFSKMQSSVYQNRGGSQHHAPSVNDVRFGGIDTKISVDQKLVPAPRPTLENTAAQEVIPPAMFVAVIAGPGPPPKLPALPILPMMPEFPPLVFLTLSVAG